MLKKILSILFILSIILFYIYYGARLSDSFKTKIEVILFVISYILFGLTLLNIILISIYWEKLSKKRGPPGQRGFKGNDGVEGVRGECSVDHNIMYALIKIKKSIVYTVLSKTTLLEEKIYNKKTNKLKNNFLDNIIERIVKSKQFDTILLKPDININIKYGKSLRDIIGYIKSIVNKWIIDILTLPGGKNFITSIDATFTITPQIENYFKNEIEKYDIWYWGGTRIFKPLKALIMRQTEYKDKNGKIYQNTAYPVEDKPRIDFISIKYSDYNTSNLNWLWDSDGIKDAEPWKDVWKNALNTKYGGTYGYYKRPAIYIPKVKTINNQRYYPLGCVMIERDENNKTNKIKKTLLVTGDVIIPKKYTLMWIDRKKMHLTKDNDPSDGKRAGVFWRIESHDPNYATLGDLFWGIKVSDSRYAKLLGSAIGIGTASVLGNAFSFGSLSLTTGGADVSATIGLSSEVSKENPDKARKKFTKPGYNYNKLKTKISIEHPEKYVGIVALPKEYLIKEKINNFPIWSYKLHSSDTYYSNYMVDIFQSDKPDDTYNILRAKNGMYRKDILHNTEKSFGPNSTKGGTFYRINKKKLYIYNNPIKTTEKINNKYGAIGWYGYPFINVDKYSIFKFMGLVPEGMIINLNNNRKLYIKHVSGDYLNRYNIFKYNIKSKKFDKALRVITPDLINYSKIRENGVSLDDDFSFIIEKDNDNNKYIRIKNIKYINDGYLEYLTNITNTNYDINKNDRPGGITIDHMESKFKLSKGKGLNTPDNNKLYIFMSTYGPKFNNDTNNTINKLKKYNFPNQTINYTPKE